jgi:nicotinamide mononucleotide transporter
MVVNNEHLSLFGSKEDKSEALYALVGSALVTLLYVFVAKSLETTTTQLEFWSLIFSFACVWLSRTENVHSMSTGIVSVVLMGIFLLRIGLVGQGWLQFVYYVPIQVYGWWAWCRGGVGRTELTVTRLSPKQWAGIVVLYIATWAGFYGLFNFLYEDPQFLTWDTSIVSASIIAQVLMTRKKVECWYVWTIPVNVSAVLLYWWASVPAFSFLYLIFLINASFGWRQWRKSADIAKQ